jgi:multiple antibiotic resistance protein
MDERLDKLIDWHAELTDLAIRFGPKVLVAILINLIFVYLVLHSLNYIARLLGTGGLLAVRKFFGVVLLAIAVKIFTTNLSGLIK